MKLRASRLIIRRGKTTARDLQKQIQTLEDILSQRDDEINRLRLTATEGILRERRRHKAGVKRGLSLFGCYKMGITRNVGHCGINGMLVMMGLQQSRPTLSAWEKKTASCIIASVRHFHSLHYRYIEWFADSLVSLPPAVIVAKPTRLWSYEICSVSGDATNTAVVHQETSVKCSLWVLCPPPPPLISQTPRAPRLMISLGARGRIRIGVCPGGPGNPEVQPGSQGGEVRVSAQPSWG
eukprot:1809047-Pyramimonas_sp.AAC.1